MFNKNVFTQKDPIADLIKGINEADYKAKMEALKGSQHKIDKNKNNKVDADDFKILRGEKKVNEEGIEEGWDDMMKAVKAKAGPQPSGGSGMKQGSRYGGSKQKDKPEHDDEKVKKEEIDPKKATTDTLMGRTKGKTGNPFASKKVMMDVPGNVSEEELDELSKATIGRYIPAAAKSRNDAFDSDYHAAQIHKAIRTGKAKTNTVSSHPGNSSTFKNPLHKDAGVQSALQKASDAMDTYRKPLQQTVSKRNAGIKRALAREEVEQVDEAGFDSMKHIDKKNQTPAIKAAAKDVKRGSYADRAALMKAGKVKDDRGPRGVTQEEVEELDERELSKGETTEKERIVKGMKKSLSGFKARYGDKAKSVMYATATKAAKKD